MIRWLKDLNRLVRWVRRDFGKNKAVFIYADGRRDIIEIDGPPRRFISVPNAVAAVITNPDELPCEPMKLLRFACVAQEWNDPIVITVYEEMT